MVEQEIETHKMNSASERGFFSLVDEPMVTGSIDSVLAKLNSTRLKKNHPKMMEVLCQGVVNLKKGFDKLGGGRVMDRHALLWTKFATDLVFDIEEWIDEPKATYFSEREMTALFKSRIRNVLEQFTWCDLLSPTEDRFKIIDDLHKDLESLKKELPYKFGPPVSLEQSVWMDQTCELVSEVETLVHDEKPGKDMDELQEKLIQDYKAKIRETREVLKHSSDKLSTASVDCPLIYEEKTRDLIALKEPSSKLLMHLAATQARLKLVSIVGMEGIGKTTLAKEVYAKLQCKFECRAFVTLGRKPSLVATRLDILHQVKPQGTIPLNGTEAPEMNQVVTELREHLVTKRYFILIDDIWSISAWDVLNSVLPENDLGSRVLITTCISDVAKCCSTRPIDFIHQMEPLSKEESKTLFHEEAKRPAENELLKMCGGMPLAILIAAGSKSAGLAEPEIRERRILSTSDQCSASDGMRMLLRMSYDELPAPLKSCLVYLSVFPEYYTIKKDRLIRLWIAERFFLGRREENLWRTGESYFNELICRRLIQPVFGYEDGQAVGCVVHGVILDFIKTLSREDNFATTSADMRSGLTPWYPIRRFSFDCCIKEDEAGKLLPETLHLSSMRTLQVCGRVGWTTLLTYPKVRKGKPALRTFKFLRVLDVEDNGILRSHHLKGIGGLILLRYLGLRGAAIHELPGEIGKLEHLETLDVRRTNLRNLPASIAGLERMVCLLIEDTVKMLGDILMMQGLQEVSTIRVDNVKSLHKVVELLVRSGRLSVLGLSFDGLDPSVDSARAIVDFLKVVGHSNLRSLSLHCLGGDLVGQLNLCPPYQLQRFELTISGAILGSTAFCMATCVTHLNIEISQLGEQGLSIIASAPHLILLKLVSSGPAAAMTDTHSSSRRQRRRVIICSGAFPCLKVFWFTCKAGGNELQFDRGAMPRLRGLRLHFNALETLSLYGDFEFGIEHLSSLTRIHAAIGCEDATAPEVELAETAITEQVCRISSANTPTIEFSREKPGMFEGEKKSVGPLTETVTTITKKRRLSRWLITQYEMMQRALCSCSCAGRRSVK
ncbi:unnamed protein product [Triticum turgidum subsp. durum]|uniref:NB-ARC domain-containing protein n=1 Tax=Triticum turgidum subsp. durum TaxID=4567 RepID=A0A9R1NJE1_TRITD|nr:unnamed protein product [Triticum turgidum subsp. durum]